MLLSTKWLREFVPFVGTAEELGQKLTMLGLELEEIIDPFENIASIVIGHVVCCERHPEADKLSVCKVDVGQEAPLDIVCGAPNVAQGQKVPVALVGTTMPGGLLIKKAKLRGQPSMGMICSERELGLSEDHTGIMVLPDDARAGQLFVEYFDLDREVLNIGVTPNRADCMSVLGLAREVALACDLPFALPSFTLDERGENASQAVAIEIADAVQCPLYQGRLVENVKIGVSPAHIRYRLHAVGVRPISNVVDVTNYVLMECGQPLHAFDAEKIRDARIGIALASEGEKVITLDGQERILTAHDLTIRDGQGVVALAGVMGGLESEITEDSQTVFLESAVFRPASIRKTSRRLGLSSEASYRFERGVDQVGNTWAMNRAAAMIAEFSGGSVRPGVCVSEPQPWQAPSMIFRLQRANALLGLELTEEFCHKVLTKIGCTVDRSDAASWRVLGPSWRCDMGREADLIEEVGRVYGLDRIEPVLPMLRHQLEDAGKPESTFAFWSRIKAWASGLGLNESVNYSFVGHKDLDFLNLPKDDRVSIINPLSSEQDALRTSLVPGLLQNVRHNRAQGNGGLRLFELAHVFHADSDSETTVAEFGRLGILLHGARFDDTWPQVDADADYSDLKGIVEHLCMTLHIGGATYTQCEAHPFLSPCVRITVQSKGQKHEHELGLMGMVQSSLADAFHAQKPVWLAEIDLDRLRALSTEARIVFQPLSNFPPVRRDVTVMGGANVRVGDVLGHVRSMKLSLFEDMTLIDMYEPEEGAYNATYRLTFRHASRTLKDAEVDKEKDKIVQSLVKALGVRV